MKLIVGTRGSKLALTQTNRTLDWIKAKNPQVEFELKIIHTLGDKEHGKPLFSIDAKGLFEKEIDQQVVNGEVDFAVHSLKDVPIVEIQTGTVIAAIPKRDSPNDVFISHNNVPFKDLPHGAVVGTGSLRRLAEIKYLRPDLDVQPIRGNVDTRINKVISGELAGIVIAQAGLERLNIADQITESLPLEHFPSAAGQGAIAVTAKEGNTKLITLLQSIEDPASKAEITAERSLVLKLEGGCRVPIGAVAKAQGNQLTLLGSIFSLNDQRKISAQANGTLNQAKELGTKVGEELINQGAEEFEKQWREKYGVW
ncbi:hydroxymethylbilane synthase [Candidatus Bathycorpusculum sp.]|uniref:hydroxymethylbilane synthase n=1 Tax=Candidatus Bathycorpusculum sp. TaxID=2994959 RepID=UPI002827634B|nr:hydroxymethylbilane synthase [Candidatus Termitimicrobium sp.]MCL2686445.1 hydroxymethylbilane synthase [Candidatus Termitimicrobium sp.]